MTSPMTRSHRRLLLDLREEGGATIVIVALVLVAMFGMIVLVVDVGGLLWKRRELVNASDAAALSAAHTCALKSTIDPKNAKQAADALALQNVSGTGLTGIVQDSGTCHTAATGWVKVQYSQQQHLFFAPVLGFSNQNGVTTKAAAIWGPAGAANPVPVIVYANSFNNCEIDQDGTPGPQCYIWEDNNNTQGSQSGFGFLDLRTDDPTKYGWDSNPGATCNDPGSDVKNWIDSYPNADVGDLSINYPNPTYVCRVDGNKAKAWANLAALKGNVLFFPINRCDPIPPGNPYGQIDSSGNEVACGNTPHQYDIIGFVALRLIEVYDPKDPAVTGSGGTCSKPLTIPQIPPGSPPAVTLSTFGSGNGCFTTAPDAYTNITLTKVKKQDPGPDPVLNQDYTIDASDPKNPVVTWVTSGPANENQTYTLSFDWQKGGQCGIPPSGNNSGHCLIVEVVDVQIGGTNPGGGGDPNSNLRAVKLCDPVVTGSCAPVTVPT
jgi:Flp pilus assembly protein TadG